MTSAFGFSGIILNGKSIQVKMGGGHIKHPRKHVSWGLHSAKSHHISMCRTSNGSSLSPNVCYSSGLERAFLVFAAYLCEGRGHSSPPLYTLSRGLRFCFWQVSKSRAPACRSLTLDFWILRVRQRHPQRHCETGQYPGQSFKTNTPSAHLLTEPLICPRGTPGLAEHRAAPLPQARPALLRRSSPSS